MSDETFSSAQDAVLKSRWQIMLAFTAIATLVLIKILVLGNKKNLFGNNNENGVQGQNKGIVRGLEALPQVQPLFPLHLIGNIPALLPMSKTMQKFVEISEKYGDAFKVTGLGKTTVAINSASLAQTLLRSSELGHVIKEPILYSLMEPLITNGVLVSTGKFWQGQRKILMKTQNISSLKACVKMLNKQSAALVEELEHVFQDAKPHPINEQINTLFLKVINEMITGFGVESSVEFNEYHHNFQTWKKCLLQRLLNPLLFLNVFWKLHPMSRQNAKAVDEMCEFAKRRLQEHRDRFKKASNVNDDDPSCENFRSVLDELIDAGVDDRQIVDEMNTMIFGGHETGATAIHFFCFAMAHNPDIQRECQREIDEHFKSGEKHDDNVVWISYEAAQSGLKYLERCILETLRLFPPVFIFSRVLETPLDIEYKGETVRLPTGVAATIFPYLLHRQERYFPKAETFNPDRFLPEEQAKRHAYSFLPFSAGSRNCLGMKFAMLEMKIVAAYLLRHFEMETIDKMDDIPLMPYVTLTPERDYTFRFKKRSA